MDLISDRPLGLKTEPLGLKVGTKNPSTISNNIYSRVITRLNDLTIKDYKSTTSKTKSLIDARLKEGFTEEDFYSGIEIEQSVLGSIIIDSTLSNNIEKKK